VLALFTSYFFVVHFATFAITFCKLCGTSYKFVAASEIASNKTYSALKVTYDALTIMCLYLHLIAVYAQQLS